jgi:hypothetical protein
LNRVASILSQLVPRSLFSELVDKHQAERHARGFSCWAQCIAMFFWRLADARSLREIVQGLADADGKLRHLGLTEATSRSTLAVASQQRPAALFGERFARRSEILRHQFPGHRFDFKHKSASIDSTLITLCVRGLPWSKHQHSKGANVPVKLPPFRSSSIDPAGCGVMAKGSGRAASSLLLSFEWLRLGLVVLFQPVAAAADVS